MHISPDTPAVWVGCLAAYNNGALYGEWVEVTSDPDELHENIKRILAGSPAPGAEEWGFFDFNFLPSSLGEYCGVATVCAVVGLYDDAREDHALTPEHVNALIENACGDVEQARRDIDSVVGVYPSFRDFADELADEAIEAHDAGRDGPDGWSFLKEFFDYAGHAEAMRYHYAALEVTGGVLVLAG